MAHELKTIDIDDEPALLRFFEEVRTSGDAYVIKHGGEDLVVVVPAEQFAREESQGRPREKTESDLQAFLSAAGAWRGKVDVEAFKRNNAESRRLSTRPAVKIG